MKKALVVVLVLMLCLSVVFVACNNDETGGKAPASELGRAKEAVERLYKDSIPAETAADYTLSKFVPLDGIYSYPITWTVDSNLISVDSVDDTQVSINVPEETSEAISYTLTATIKADDGTIATVVFERTVPAFHLSTYAEYVAAADNSTIVIDGIVTAILPKDNGASINGIYMNTYDADGNPDGGVYVYNSPATYPTDLAIGVKVRVTGSKTNYSGTHEIQSASVKVLDSTATEVTPVDYTEILTNAASLTDATLVGKQAMLVKISGVEIGKTGGSDGSYYYFTLGNHRTYVRISSSACPLTTEEQNEFKTFFASHEGYTADVTGVVCVYSGAFYLTPVSENAFSNAYMPNYTDAEKVERAKNSLEVIDNVTADSVLDLGTVSQIHNDVTISWTVSDNDCAVLNAEEGTLTVTLPEEAVSITLTATLRCGEASDTKEFSVLIDAASLQQYLPKAIESPVAGTYKFALYQANLGTYLYADGTVDASEYLATTDKAEKAADVVLVAVDGGYNIKIGDKFVEIYENASAKVRTHLVDAATGVWTWNEELQIFTWTLSGCTTESNNDTYYLGTYNTYNTISASKTSYITAANKGVSQFPAQLGTKCFVEEELSDEDKVAEAKDNLTVTTITTENLTLPATSGEVTITWASSNADVIATDGTVTRGAEDVVVTLTATLTLNEARDTKTFDVTVKAEGATLDAQNLDFVTNFATYSSSWGSGYAERVISFTDLCGTVEGTVTLSNGSVQTGTITDRPVPAAKSTATQYVTVQVNAGSISTVAFELSQWGTKTFTDMHIEYFDGTNWVSCSDSITTPGSIASNVALPSGVTQVRLAYSTSNSGNTQFGLTSIELVLA